MRENMKEMKKMKYDGTKGILYYAKDEEGYGIAVISMGSHPCGYITFPGIEKVKGYDNFYVYRKNDPFNGIDHYAHGGYTFFGDLDRWGLEGIWIGWDYAHYDDFTYYGDIITSFFDGKKWTTEEIALSALCQIMYIRNGWYEISDEDEC